MSEPGLRRYMVGDVVRLELDLEHAANLARLFVAFSHERDRLAELYFEATEFPAATEASGGSKRSRIPLAAPVPPSVIPGVYELTRVNVFSVGGRLARLTDREFAGLTGARFEIVEEPAEVPAVAGLEFLS